jgi:hypothetical protein
VRGAAVAGEALLLAEDGVAGVARGDGRAHVGLGLAVGDGDRGLVGLAVHGQVALEVAQGDLAGLPGDLVGEAE